MHGEETGIYFIPTPHTFIGPFNAVWKPFEGGLAIRDVEDIAPDAFHRCGDQVRFAVKIIIDGADGILQACATLRMLTAAQPFSWISLRLVSKMASLEVMTVFTFSRPYSEQCSL